MESYIAEFIAIVNGVKLSTLGAMIIVNFILGIAVGLKNGTFELKGLADFLRSRVLPYLLGYFAVGIMAVVEPSWRAFVTVVWGIIVATLVGAILQNLKELGIKLPDFMGGGSK